jgi:hypothetical protein
VFCGPDSCYDGVICTSLSVVALRLCVHLHDLSCTYLCFFLWTGPVVRRVCCDSEVPSVPRLTMRIVPEITYFLFLSTRR